MAEPAVLDDRADAAAGADAADDGGSRPAVTPAGSSPSTLTAMVPGRCWGRVWVARDVLDLAGADAEGEGAEARGSTCGCRRRRWSCPAGWGLLGADHVDDALAGSPIGYSVMPNSAQLARSTSTCLREIGSAMGWSMSAVGTLWSSVAIVRSGRRTGAPGHPEAVEGLR